MIPSDGPRSVFARSGPDGDLEQSYRATVIMAAAMGFSVLLYAGIVELLHRLMPSPPLAEPGMLESLRQILRGLALVHLVALAWLGRRSKASEGTRAVRIQRLRALALVGLALAEAIAIYGLVLFLLSRVPQDFYFLLLLSLLGFALAFPRRDRWREALAA
jgi:hypothetical protein